MTTRHTLLEEWQQRLAKLNRLIKSRSHPVWLYEIRIKILKYLISRYGHQKVSENEFVRSHSGYGEQKAYIAVDNSHRRGAAPKTREMIRSLLEDIHLTVHSTSRK